MADQVPSGPALIEPPAEALARVPGLEQGQQPLAIERLGGGTVNEVFRVDTPAGRFVVRLNGAAWRRPGVDRARELNLHRCAAAGSIAPPIVVADPGFNGLLVMEYLPGCTWVADDYNDVTALTRLAERLQALHALRPPKVAPFDPYAIAQSYVSAINPEHQELAPQLQRLQSLCEPLQTAEHLTIVHGDLWHSNILQGERLWLLDWEYAQISDPIMDIACLLAYYPQAVRYRGELAAAAGLAARSVEQELADGVAIYQILNWLWHLARGEAAPLPSSRGW